MNKIYQQVPTSYYLKNLSIQEYYTGDYKISLNLFSFNFNFNLMAWLKSDFATASSLSTEEVIRYAKEAGFDAVDITAYYIPGYDSSHSFFNNQKKLNKSDRDIIAYVQNLKALCEAIGIEISGTGVKNDFALPDEVSRKEEVHHVKKWIDIAEILGAPVIRVFSGLVPEDIEQFGWEKITKERIVPALREVAAYGETKGVKVAVQNHADMLCTADQVIKLVNWVDHPNLGVVNDTGCYREFNNPDGVGYQWYDDIEAVLPYSVNFQIKSKPAGEETDIPMDLEELFKRIRSSSYRGYLPIEVLWGRNDPNHPNRTAEPPFEEVTAFLQEVKDAMEKTKVLEVKKG